MKKNYQQEEAMDRGGLTYIFVFISGIAVSNCLSIPPSIGLLLPVFVTVALLFTRLIFSGSIQKKSLSGTRFFLITSHLILFLIGFGHHTLYQSPSGEGKPQPELSVREELKTGVRDLVQTPREQAVLAALTLGDKSTLPRDLKKAYGNSGAMHILALSGLHMGIIYSFVSGFLFFLNTTRRLRIVKAVAASILILWYGYITGFPPSVQRAILMILFQNILYLSGRKTDRMNLIASAAFVILLISPSDLFSISFQLSFAAVLGIALIFPVIEASFQQVYPNHSPSTLPVFWRGIRKWVRKGCYAVWCLMGISISCQITTLPFTWFYFESAPPFFLLTNLAAIPIATLVLYLFIPAMILLKVPILGEILAVILQKLLELLNDLIEWIG